MKLSTPLRPWAALLGLFAPVLASATPLFEVSETSGIILEEGGEWYPVEVRLLYPPGPGNEVYLGVNTNSSDPNNIDVGCYSDPTREIAVICDSLVFNNDNWNVPQYQWILPNLDFNNQNGQIGPMVDGDQPWQFEFEIRGGPPPFDNNDQSVLISGINVDMDAGFIDPNQPGIRVPTLTPTLNESDGDVDLGTTVANGGWATWDFTLSQSVGYDVRVTVESSDDSELLVPVGGRVFIIRPGSSFPNRLSLMPVNDTAFDGDQEVELIVRFDRTNDSLYRGTEQRIPLTIVDDETGGLVVQPTSGLVTTEDGLQTDTYEISLQGPPAGTLELGSSPDVTEGMVSPEVVTFDSGNWEQAQTVTVTGIDDLVLDGDITYDIIVEDVTPQVTPGPELFTNPTFTSGVDGWAGDIGYGEDVFPNDQLTTAGQSEFSISQTVTGLEPGCEYKFTVETAQIAYDWTSWQTAVHYGLAVGHQEVGGAVESRNWNSFHETGEVSRTYFAYWPETVFTLTGRELTLGAARPHIVNSVSLTKLRCPSGYDDLEPVAVEVTNLDGFVAGFDVLASGGIVSEAGETSSLDVSFDSQPLAPVTLLLSISDTTEGAVNETSVTVSPDQWDNVPSIPVMGVDDLEVDGDIPFTITVLTSSADPSYDGLVSEASFTNQDDDVAQVLIGSALNSAAPIVVTEAGHSAFTTVWLSARPVEDVTITLTASDDTEGELSPAELIFTADNWNLPAQVYVTGVDDDAVDGNINFTVDATSASSDTEWAGLTIPTIHVRNLDDDAAGLWVRPAAGGTRLWTGEDGTSDDLAVSLLAEPLEDVTITLAVRNEAEASITTTTLTFTAADYDVAQTIAVTGVDDEEVDGDRIFDVTANATSTDPSYDGLTASTPGINVDDDVLPEAECSLCDLVDVLGEDEEEEPQWAQGTCGSCSSSGPSGSALLLLLAPLLMLRRRQA